MKQLLLALCLGSIFLLSSCSQDSSPVVEVTVTVKQSERFSNASFTIASIDFFELDPITNTIGVSNLQRWSGVELDMNLNETQSFLIANDAHWALDLAGMKLSLFGLKVGNQFVSNSPVKVSYVDFVPLRDAITLEDNKSYAVEFIIDFDKINQVASSGLIYAHNYEVIVTEL